MTDSELREQNLKLREELLDLKEQLVEKNQRIADLEQQVRKLETGAQDALLFHNGACYERDQQGKPTGDPYCPVCWEREGLRLHLIRTNPAAPYECQNCRAKIRIGEPPPDPRARKR
jgi:hypothetical protein